MLLVNATRGLSKVHGHGLIANQFVPSGTHIWKFNPAFDVRIDEHDALKLSTPAFAQLRYYCYFDLDERAYILSSDDDRYTNHSDTPNTRVVDGQHTEAIRDIAEGEEITCDYFELGWTDYLGLPPDSKASLPADG